MSATLEVLCALQRPDGGFDSLLSQGVERVPDCNGFTAALVLRALRHVSPSPPLQGLRRRALDFLEACASEKVAGAYAFWSPSLRPAWAASVPADVDDTAIFACELFRHGRADRDATWHSLGSILSQRVGPGEAAMRPAWIATGCFHTWIDAPSSRQVVDCCVNANVAALMATLGGRGLPGYLDAVRTIDQGLLWADGNAVRLDSLAPFYAGPHALREAVEHAIECGAVELRDAGLRLKSLAPGRPPVGAACCRGAYARATWHCEALDAARNLAAEPAPEDRRITCLS